MAVKGAIIAIDFDGTVVTHAYPHMGMDAGAVPVLKELVANDCKLILYTCLLYTSVGFKICRSFCFI